MTMTKRKKRTVILVSVLLILAAVLGLLAWRVKTGWRTIIETTDLPPAPPDSVQFWKGKAKHTLSEQDAQTVYRTMVEIMDKCDRTTTYLMYYSDERTQDFLNDYGGFVLQYSDVYKFTGTFPDKLQYLQTFEQKEFNSIVFWPSGYSFDMLLFLDSNCINGCYCILLLSQREDAKTLVKTLQEVLSHYDFDKPDWATAEIK